MEKNNSRKFPAFVILGIIALVAALVLALTNAITKGPIAEHQMAALRDAFSEVMPAEEYEEIQVPATYGVSSLYAAKSGGEVVGYCVTAVGQGYGGDVAVTMGVGTDGLVTGVVVGDINFAETSGFGSRAREPGFREQFVGLDAVNGGSFEALSGATVTSTAVLNAVNKALPCVDEMALNQAPAASPLVAFGAPAERPEAAELTGTVLTGSAQGFKSEVKVEISLDADGAISGINIDSEGETEGIGQRLMTEPEFGEQFIGQTGPFALGENIDVVSGVTVTSTAVVEAVNAALSAPTSASGAVVTGTAQGFKSEVTVTLTVEDGAITAIEIDSADETEGIGTRVMDDADFLNQFVGLSAPLTLGENVNVLSGATVTSTAVVEAANAALASADAPAEETLETIATGDDATLGLRADGSAVVAPAEGFSGEVSLHVTVEDGKIVAGEFAAPAEAPAEDAAPATELTGKKQGFESDVKVTVTVNEDGTIATLVVDASGETPGIGQKASEEAFTAQFIGKGAPFVVGENIDGISGATWTTNAVVDTLNELLAVEEPAEEVVAAPVTELTGKKQGFESDVKVTVTVNEDGTIATLVVDASGETPGIGQKASEEDFTAQFIGKSAPFVVGENIDGISGATWTTNAVVDTLNELLITEEEPAEEAAVPVTELTGKKQGFESDVKVTVTVNEDGTIATLTVDASGETPGIGQKASEEAFTAQFIGKKAPFVVGENIDGISGATWTTNAVVDTLNELLAVEEPAEEVAAAPVTELTGKKQGFESDVKVTVTVNEDGTIATLVVDASGETPGIGQKASEEAFTAQFIGKSAPFVVGENIDGISGATWTTNAVVETLNELLATEEEPAEDAAPVTELTGKKQGFESDVKVTVTVNEDGTIATLVVDASGETPGIGQKASEEAFTAQFIGKSAPFVVGENIDGISGATWTTNAVIETLNELLVTEEEPAEEAAPVTELTGKKQGFESDVKVTVTVNEDGTIATLVVDASGETPGIGQKASEEAFTAQFIGKSAPFVVGENIDGISGATWTTSAVVDTLNELLAVEEPAEEVAAAPVTELTGKKQGFESDVKVTVTVNEDGTIATLTVDASGETPGIGQKASEEAFTAQFIGKSAPFVVGENIDGISGATWTTNAVVETLNELLVTEEEPAEDAAPVTELTGKKQGFESDVKVTVTVNEDGTIATLTVDASGETPGIGQKASEEAFTAQFIGKSAPFVVGENIDGISGATWTTSAVVDTLNELLMGE